MCVALNGKVNSENQLNSLGITNVVAMTKALLTSLNAIYSVFKIPVDSALPDALTNESDVRLPTRLGLNSASAELSVLSVDPSPAMTKSLRLTGPILLRYLPLCQCVLLRLCSTLT